MAKKIGAFLLLIVCALFVVKGTVYIRKSGIFDPLSEPQYLTAEEEALRPFYQSLSESEKAVYTAVYRGICNHDVEIPLPYEIDGETYSKIYRLIEKQESGLFCIDSSYYTAEKIRKAQIIYKDADAQKCAELSCQMKDAADKVLSAVPKGDDYLTALYIHDYLIENCEYKVGGNNYDSSAYGCLVIGEALCEGYAKAFDYLAKRAGLGSVVVTGVSGSGENHAWNQVEINGEWYNVDVTWDDADNEIGIRHTYFLCGDDNFSDSHIADTDYFSMFDCTGEAIDYFTVNDLIVADMVDAERILQREIMLNKKAIELKFISGSVSEEFKASYIEGEKIFDVIFESASIISTSSVTISVAENEEEQCLTILLS